MSSEDEHDSVGDYEDAKENDAEFVPEGEESTEAKTVVTSSNSLLSPLTGVSSSQVYFDKQGNMHRAQKQPRKKTKVDWFTMLTRKTNMLP